MFLQDLGGCFQIGGLVGCDDVFFGHHLINMFVEVSFETQVAVGHNAYQALFIVYHRDAADFIFGHQGQCVRHG